MKGTYKAMKALNGFVNEKDSYPKLDKSLINYLFEILYCQSYGNCRSAIFCELNVYRIDI
jgi:hypothetical protein